MKSNHFLQNFKNNLNEYIEVSYSEFYAELEHLEDSFISEFNEIILSNNHKLYQTTYRRDDQIKAIYEIIEINKKSYFFITILE